MGPVRRVRARSWAIRSGFTGAVIGSVILWFVFAFATGKVGNPLAWLVILSPIGCAAAATRWPLGGSICLAAEGLAFSGMGIMAILVAIAVRSQQGPGSMPGWLVSLPLLAGLLQIFSGALFMLSRER